MKNLILGRKWPDTKRKIPRDVEFTIVNVHPKWDDLCYKRIGSDGNITIVYLSTLPHI